VGSVGGQRGRPLPPPTVQVVDENEAVALSEHVLDIAVDRFNGHMLRAKCRKRKEGVY
jgi:hypothetical protein